MRHYYDCRSLEIQIASIDGQGFATPRGARLPHQKVHSIVGALLNSSACTLEAK